MKTKSFLLMPFLMAMIFSIACNRETLSGKIQRLEKQMLDDEGFLVKEVGEELITYYITFAEENLDNKQSPEYLFKAVNISVNMDNPQRTIEIADKLIKNFPQYDNTPMAMFIKGFVYETQFNDIDEARKIYHLFIDTYPDDEMVDDAKAAIENLGLTPEELIKKFEEKNKN